ncbi:MAG: glycosyltransferase [Gammaproteobacteria bacterium]
MSGAAAGVLLSVAVPVYRGAPLLEETFAAILALEPLLSGARVEIVAADDGSDDGSFAEILRLQKLHPQKIRAVRLRRNYGAMAAVQAALAHARGDCAAVLPQDLQDPPRHLAEMFDAWRGGEKVNMTYRTAREEPLLKKAAAFVYHSLFRALTGVKYPPGGLGVFLIDREVADEIVCRPENHSDILLRVFSMGYPVRLHPAPRLPPKMKSQWTFAKSIKLAVDNFIGFSYLPVRLMSFAGIAVAFAGFCFAGYVLLGKLTGWYPINQPPGWATIVVLLSFLLGMIMLMLGVIGEYLWRILDKVRGAPIYRIAEVQNGETPAAESSRGAQKLPQDESENRAG